MSDYAQKIIDTLSALELDKMAPLLKEALNQEEDPFDLLNAMNDGMAEVGKLFESGEYYLADMILAGEMMKEGMKILEPLLQMEEHSYKGTVVLCTVKGDIHDIGKNIVGTMLSSAGFRVIDLGVDVPPERVVQAVQENDASVVALSVLLTTMTQSVGEVITALIDKGLHKGVKIIIGGACATPELADEMGADAYGENAVEAVKILHSWCG